MRRPRTIRDYRRLSRERGYQELEPKTLPAEQYSMQKNTTREGVTALCSTASIVDFRCRDKKGEGRASFAIESDTIRLALRTCRKTSFSSSGTSPVHLFTAALPALAASASS